MDKFVPVEKQKGNFILNIPEPDKKLKETIKVGDIVEVTEGNVVHKYKITRRYFKRNKFFMEKI